MAVPKLSKDRFKVEVKDNRLCISSEQKEEKKMKKKTIQHVASFATKVLCIAFRFPKTPMPIKSKPNTKMAC